MQPQENAEGLDNKVALLAKSQSAKKEK